jgi:hypothetical protein
LIISIWHTRTVSRELRGGITSCAQIMFFPLFFMFYYSFFLFTYFYFMKTMMNFEGRLSVLSHLLPSSFRHVVYRQSWRNSNASDLRSKSLPHFYRAQHLLHTIFLHLSNYKLLFYQTLHLNNVFCTFFLINKLGTSANNEMLYNMSLFIDNRYRLNSYGRIGI